MANRTSWVSGNGQGLTYGAAFNSTDFTSAQPTTGQTLMSTVTITNGTELDTLMDIGFVQSIASNTTTASSYFTLWLCSLKPDGSTYWPPLTAGTAGSPIPPWTPIITIPLFAGTAQTTLVGSTADFGTPVILPPGSFRLILQNNCGFTLTATTQIWDYRTYNINLND